MKTNFFTHLQAIGIKHSVIEIKESGDGNTTVMITPKSKASDSALKTLKPIFITGPAADLDNEFFETVTGPLEATQRTFSNVENYEAQRKEAEKETAEKAEQKKKVKAAEEALKKVYEAKDFNIDKDKAKAMKLIDALLEVDPDNSYGKKAKADIIEKAQSAAGLFSMMAEPEPEEPKAQEQPEPETAPEPEPEAISETEPETETEPEPEEVTEKENE